MEYLGCFNSFTNNTYIIFSVNNITYQNPTNLLIIFHKKLYSVRYMNIIRMNL